MTGAFHIINLGCKVNKVEADHMSAQLLSVGAIQGALSQADLVLINTCTVTGEADTKSRKAAHRALREAPGATVIITGCGASASPEQFQEDTSQLELIANKEQALERAAELLQVSLHNTSRKPVRVGEEFNTRVAIKVQDGCDNACSYCIVPTARGAAHSMSHQGIREEVKAHIDAGAKEVVLTGIDLGSYEEGSMQLAELLKSLLTCSPEFRIRLSSIELPSITNELIRVLKTHTGRVCAHLHIPLQSGSDAILAAMKRRYDAQTFLSTIKHLRAELPHISLSTDVIVGFPGETELDFEASKRVCEQAGFSRIHVFRYSKRPGTPAAEMPHEIEPVCMARRAKELRELAVHLAQKDALSRIGTRESVLYENAERGRTESYYPVHNTSGIERGKLVSMELTGFEDGSFTAREV